MEPALSPEHAEALRNREALLSEYAELEERHSQLLYHEKPRIEREYLQKVGRHKLELFEVRTEVYRLKRKVELIRTAMNRAEPVQMKEINRILEAEMYQQYQELKLRAEKLEKALVPDNRSLDDEEAQDLREIYYKLVKKLHPDLNPDLSPALSALWHQVVQSYKAGDLEKLRMLEIVFDASGSRHDSPSLLDDIKEHNARVANAIIKMIKALEDILREFPFNIAEFLDNEEWVIEENNSTLNQISKTMDEKKYYMELLNELIKSANEQ
ncbi:MAG: hypothetical protein DWQ44_03775 [Bacteroidetes bacterium]|nr:MAG: hypothetical protein DWQ33_00065 [Bacteroidota bacterium]REK00420.1 MAG: hypothetical protein DWQ39_11755 [Bacteroidota bacterium]REK05073.1 MAG: hypothetical protein DWQ39_07655 [Bacteroidota bacterium]REK35538.1 MAG: hypothetical protein DWQ44_03775 [Bacteroidota bacterium]REK51640.1 MAG: hypothetical protein DWQ48_00350 [Bacteroidota bacterium]